MCSSWWPGSMTCQTLRRRWPWLRNSHRKCLIPVPTGARTRKKEFLERCQTALKQKNPLASVDVQTLPTEGQRSIALALEPSKYICSKCSKLADTSMDFDLEWLSGVPSASPETHFFCAACKPALAAVCGNCGKHSSLVRDETLPRQLLPFWLTGVHVLNDLRCQDCGTPGVAPLTCGETRKRIGHNICLDERAAKQRRL